VELLHTIAGVWEQTGGPAVSVPALCMALARCGHGVTLLTGQGPLGASVKEAAASIRVREVALGPYYLAHFSRGFARACKEEAARADIVHTHGLWLQPNWVSARVAQRLGKPLVISPRGMLDPWALRRSPLLKRAAWLLIERRSFADASLIHATSAAEAQQIRELGVTAPIAVIPNGVDLEGDFGPERLARVREGTANGGRGVKRVLFLSRIHPKKGLDALLEAWGRLRRSPTAAELLIVGPGEPRHLAWLRTRLSRVDAAGIRYLGPVHGDAKLALLAGAHVLVLPSYSENYGMVVVEALACGTPVIASTATPWPSLAERGCGWWVEPRADILAAVLESSLGLPDEARDEMGRRGRALVEDQHSLSAAAAKMEASYRWLIGEARQPESVFAATVP